MTRPFASTLICTWRIGKGPKPVPVWPPLPSTNSVDESQTSWPCVRSDALLIWDHFGMLEAGSLNDLIKVLKCIARSYTDDLHPSIVFHCIPNKFRLYRQPCAMRCYTATLTIHGWHGSHASLNQFILTDRVGSMRRTSSLHRRPHTNSGSRPGVPEAQFGLDGRPISVWIRISFMFF